MKNDTNVSKKVGRVYAYIMFLYSKTLMLTHKNWIDVEEESKKWIGATAAQIEFQMSTIHDP